MGIFTKLFGSQIEVDVQNTVERVMNQKLNETMTAFGTIDELTAQKAKLGDELYGMRREKETLADDMAREELAVKHKLGLERMRQEQEAEMAAKELDAQRARISADRDLAVKSAKLEAKTEATEEARAMMNEFQDRQEKMIDSLLKALPSAEILMKAKV